MQLLIMQAKLNLLVRVKKLQICKIKKGHFYPPNTKRSRENGQVSGLRLDSWEECPQRAFIHLSHTVSQLTKK